MNVIQVAVGVIKNKRGEVLLAKRPAHVHQGGLWEFAGGKIEYGETAEQALQRELHEELGIEVSAFTPLITIPHDYDDVRVCLQVFMIQQFHGTVQSKEGQALCWVKPEQLQHYALPSANRAIISAVQLPPYYAILDDAEQASLFTRLEQLLTQGMTLIQARLKRLSAEQVAQFMYYAQPLCEQYRAVLLLNSESAQARELAVDGLHLTSRDLLALNARLPDYRYLSASCHNQQELDHAQNIGIDFVVLAPVFTTATHAYAQPLGWHKFTALTAACPCPVYALGGLQKNDLFTAQHAGAQGIAAIRAFL